MNAPNTKETIAARALELFSSRGFESVGVQELVDAAGITKPTLYYYFGSKEGLLKHILAENYSLLGAALRRAAVYRANPSDYFADVYPVLKNLALAYFGFAKEHEAFYRMALAMQYLPPTSQTALLAKSFHHEQFGIMEGLFSQFSAAHRNMRGKERRYAWNFIGMVNCHIGLWYGGELELGEDVAKAAVRQYMHGIFS